MTNAEMYINLPLYPHFPLTPIVTVQGGAVYVRVPNVPEDVANLSVVLTASGTLEPVRIPLDSVTCGAWVEPYLYPAVGLGFYEIVGMRDGRRIWFGRGDWRVIASEACGDPEMPGPPAGEINAGYFPVDLSVGGQKIYRKLSVEIEHETGEPVSRWSRELYRFNFATGVYEEVQ